MVTVKPTYIALVACCFMYLVFEYRYDALASKMDKAAEAVAILKQENNVLWIELDRQTAVLPPPKFLAAAR